MHIIAAKAVGLEEALKPGFADYQRQVVANARVLAEELLGFGFDLVSGGTDNHLILIDVSGMNMTGLEAERALGEVGIVANKNSIPFDKKSPTVTSGLRLGTPALTTRGFREREMRIIAELIRKVLEDPGAGQVLARVREVVDDLCVNFPMYQYLSGEF